MSGEPSRGLHGIKAIRLSRTLSGIRVTDGHFVVLICFGVLPEGTGLSIGPTQPFVGFPGLQLQAGAMGPLHSYLLN